MGISFIGWITPLAVALVILLTVSYMSSLWRHRVVLGDLVSGLLIAGLPFVFVAEFPGWVVIGICALQAWLLILSLRIAFGRLSVEFLQESTERNCWIAVGLLGSIFALWLIPEYFSLVVEGELVLTSVLIAALTTATVYIAQVTWTFWHYRVRKPSRPVAFKHLPTVTLAIPARNESPVLTESLQAALASDYPKLEILVVDDCSYDKTSQVVRAFAQQGVRFVQGEIPADGWLGKNQACQTLVEHASGDYIVFSGVDTHIGPKSISNLIEYMVANDRTMVSVLPQNRMGIHVSTLLQQLRYYWQIALPITKSRVPVASQLWAIEAATLKQLGGFNAVKNKIVPEGYFARRLAMVDAYRFVIADAALDITSAKRWTSQNETAMRLLYPTLKRQPLYVLVSLFLLVFLSLSPFVVTAYLGAQGYYSDVFWLAVISSFLLLLSYASVVIRTTPNTWLLTVLCFPLSLIQEAGLLVLSMLQYEFGEVNWKGRNVCYPVILPSASPAMLRELRSARKL